MDLEYSAALTIGEERKIYRHKQNNRHINPDILPYKYITKTNSMEQS
jgi:hypothetical protein